MARSPDITEAQAAEQLGLAAETLRDWRKSGRPRIPYVKHPGINGPVRYKQGDVDRYRDACLVTP